MNYFDMKVIMKSAIIKQNLENLTFFWGELF